MHSIVELLLCTILTQLGNTFFSSLIHEIIAAQQGFILAQRNTRSPFRMYREIDSRILRQIGESHFFRVSSPFTPIRSTRRHSNFLSRGIPTTQWVWAGFGSKDRDFRRDFVFRGSLRSNDPCPPRTSRLSVAKEILVPCRGSSRGPT